MLQDIVNVLKDTTKENPMPVKQISEILGIKDTSGCPRTRKLILKAMKQFNVPIGSNNFGYFLIRTEKEMQEYLNKLMQLQIALSDRIKVTYYAFHGRN